jgi:tetratricopeptide (TPR) repeat protein
MIRNSLFLLLLCSFTLQPAVAEPNIQSLIEAGNLQWQEGKVSDAEASFRQAIDLAPESAKAYTRLGSLYLTQNRTSEAISIYQQAIMRDAENPQLFMALSIAYLHQAHYAMAQAMVEQALSLNPELKDALKMQEYIETKQQLLSETESELRRDK